MIEHEGTMYAVLKRYGLYDKREDYIDICYIGYTKALNSFDDSKGSLRNYIYNCVENAIISELRKERVGKRQREEFSLDFNYDDYGHTMNDVIADDIDLERDIIIKENNKELYNCISKLSKIERYIIINCFNLCENKKTQNEIANMLKINQAQVSKIKYKALIKLRGMLE